MNDQEKIQSYIELYKIQLERYDKRRNFEWKVTMGLWTSIVVLTGFLAGKVHLSWTALGGYIFILIIFSTLWTCGGWLANAKDRNHALVYLNRIEMLLGYTSEEKNYEKPRRLECYKNWSRLFQIMAAGIIMFLSWYFLYIIPVSPHSKASKQTINKSSINSNDVVPTVPN